MAQTIKISIAKACPSAQSHSIAKNLQEWRLSICDFLLRKKLVEKDFESPENGIRHFIQTYLNGGSYITLKFYLKKTKHVPDLDNMTSFILCLFKTEATEEAKQIENTGIRPWFYYPAFELPGELNFWEGSSEKILGAQTDLTEITLGLLSKGQMGRGPTG